MAYDVMAGIAKLEDKIERDVLPGRGSRKDLLATMRKRFEQASSQEAKNRVDALDDLKFKAGEQWPASVKAEREAEQRPCLTVNKIKTFVHQVTNDMRQNRPAINVSPVGDRADVKTAQMLKGLIRYIERHSDADLAYDTAFDNSVSNGFGYWMLATDYEGPDTFDQCIMLKRVPNPFVIYVDPTATDPCGADAKFAFRAEMVPKDEFKRLYPDADPMNWNDAGPGDDWRAWVSDTHVRLVEYYCIHTKMRRLVALKNGHVGYFDDLDDLVKQRIKADKSYIVNDRECEVESVYCYKCSAVEILEEYVWAGSTIPIVREIGDEVNLEGKPYYSGVIRDAKDPQRMYNYWVTSETESTALQPKAPWVMEEGQVEGHEARWKFANKKIIPYLLYKGTNVGGKPAPPPRREPPPQASSGIAAAKEGSAQDMMATTGIRFDATKSERVQDESGVALRALRQNTELGSFHYIDNHARALRRTGNMIIELIPKVYDTKRMAVILREDGSEQVVQINPHQASPHEEVKDEASGKTLDSFNPNVGKYEVTVTIGPSYATKRIEAANELFKFAQAFPNAAQYIADLVAKNSDWPEAEQLSKRLAMLLPPNMLQPEQKDMSPQVQAYIGALTQQLQQSAQMIQQLQAAVTEKKTEQAITVDKNEKDYEAKILAIVEKAQTAAEDRAAAREATFLTHLRAELEAIRSLSTQPGGQAGARSVQ